METIRQFFASPEWAALLAGAISFLTANLGTIIIFAVKYIGLKKQEIKNKAESDEIIAAIEAKYGAQISGLEKMMDEKLEQVCATVIKKMDDDERIKQEQIEKETLDLEAAIAATKNALKKDEASE